MSLTPMLIRTNAILSQVSQQLPFTAYARALRGNTNQLGHLGQLPNDHLQLPLDRLTRYLLGLRS